ncbi:MAG: hypothetical protein HS117_11245 [Verrucomicrobiaceae bacterium]|jgi:phospholipid/cholesterol/gamma-HCH transport system ATP-binding protein|nr:hypothetical protein [Verrucomicrobiaceae bacterium]
MPEVIASIDQISTESFRSATMRLEAGTLGIVVTSSIDQGRDFVDTLLGLAAPEQGVVRLLGQPLYELPESRRLALLAQVGHAGGGLISNLKIWENVSLPALFHPTSTPDEVEARLIEAIGQLPNKEEWMQKRLPALPDTLSRYAQRMAGLIRCAALRPRLLVAEFLLDDLEGEAIGRLVDMLAWLRRKEPPPAVLLLHLGAATAGHSTLQSLQPDWMIQLEKPTP